MAQYGRNIDSVDQLRSLQEQVRRLRVRLRDDQIGPEPWISAEGLLNTGWSTDGDPLNGLHARYYRHHGRVWWGGTIEYVGGVGAEPILPILLTPVEYRPDRLVNADLAFDQDSSSGYVSGDWLPVGLGGAMLALDSSIALGDALILDNLSYRHQ